MKYEIVIQPTALRMLTDIKDLYIRRKITERIDGLAHDPEMQGKPLLRELSGFRSLRAAGQRYRIIYSVHRSKVYVSVVAIGIRRARDKGIFMNWREGS